MKNSRSSFFLISNSIENQQKQFFSVVSDVCKQVNIRCSDRLINFPGQMANTWNVNKAIFLITPKDSLTTQSILKNIKDISNTDFTNLKIDQSVPVNVSDLRNDLGYITTQTDPIYIADKPNIALKVQIPTKISQLTNDKNYLTATEVNQIKNTIVSSIPTKISQLTNDKNYLTATEVNQITNNVVSQIPTKISQLINDKNYLDVETDPIYIADKPNIALKQQIPTKVSQLTNDKNYISKQFGTGDAILIIKNGEITQLSKPSVKSVLVFDGTDFNWIPYNQC